MGRKQTRIEFLDGSKNKQALVGRVFGDWTVLAAGPPSSKWLFICQCACGSVSRPISGYSLLGGTSRSCGHAQNKYHIGRTRKGTARHKVFYTYKRTAKERGLSFNLSEDDLEKIVTQPCKYCRLAPDNVSESKAGEIFRYNGIDRVDNLIGYDIENCNPCCRPCNIAKNNGTLAEYIARCKRVSARCATL